ncbi:sulfurtransferase TusA family protein [Brevundimonas bullata]|uniref:sulfurtransferase TusA family protein n=1 Tax=Brevundimonas TaxID=41275 RepID=UPI000E0A02CA|nr:sulfurtransferase TusA family protein [Brevundimonas bullata]NWE52185.1 sulfurtransferase TusA family protein [Brevundimonas sp. P7753]WQE38436.1 sulfurtransferase TusA family protein [Brevundimonas bullata]
MSEAVVVDARGHRCPVPSLRLRKAMEGLRPGARLILLATDPMARIDVPYLMGDLGGTVCEVEEQDGVLRITVETGAAPTD